MKKNGQWRHMEAKEKRQRFVIARKERSEDMVISSKGRYALRVMVYLAVHHSEEFIPLKEISQSENLSQKYLESITRMLSKAHLIEAASGHGGGYRLTRKPEKYSVGEILRLTEGSLAPVSCLEDDRAPCDRSDLCYVLPIWQGLADLINDYFDNMTLADVAYGSKAHNEHKQTAYT